MQLSTQSNKSIVCKTPQSNMLSSSYYTQPSPSRYMANLEQKLIKQANQYSNKFFTQLIEQLTNYQREIKIKEDDEKIYQLSIDQLKQKQKIILSIVDKIKKFGSYTQNCILTDSCRMQVQKYIKKIFHSIKFVSIFKFNQQWYSQIQKIKSSYHQEYQLCSESQQGKKYLLSLSEKLKQVQKMKNSLNTPKRIKQLNNILNCDMKQYNNILSWEALINAMKDNINNIYLRRMQCIGCIQYFFQNQVVFFDNFSTPTKNIKIIKAQNQIFRHLQREQIRISLCKLFNNAQGYLLFGINPPTNVNEGYIIKGINFTDKNKHEFEKQCKKLIQQYIQSKQSKQSKIFDEGITIGYIPIIKSLQKISREQWYEKWYKNAIQYPIQEIMDKIFQQLYIIRIKINLPQQDHTNLYYILAPLMGENRIKYNFYDYDNNIDNIYAYMPQKQYPISCHIIYQEIHKKYMKNRKYQQKSRSNKKLTSHPNNIRCLKPIEMVKQSQNMNVKSEQNIFPEGQRPNKIYNHEFILLVNIYKQQQYIQYLKQQLHTNKIKYKIHKIYQHLKRSSQCHRIAYYITTSVKKVQYLQQIIQNKNNNPNQWIILPIKNQFMLKESKNMEKANKILKQKFQSVFKKSFTIGIKYIKDSTNQIQCYIVFDKQQNTQAALYAFLLLQYENIRSNFVNKKKVENFDQIPQLLKKNYK